MKSSLFNTLSTLKGLSHSIKLLLPHPQYIHAHGLVSIHTLTHTQYVNFRYGVGEFDVTVPVDYRGYEGLWSGDGAELHRKLRHHPLDGGGGVDPDCEPHLGRLAQGGADADDDGARFRPRNVPRRHLLARRLRQIAGITGPVPPPSTQLTLE